MIIHQTEAGKELEKRIQARNKAINRARKVPLVRVDICNKVQGFSNGILSLTLAQSYALREALLEAELKLISRNAI